MDFLNPKAVRELMYLYPTRGSSLPQHPGYLDRRGRSIIENVDFARDWLPMSLQVKDRRWLVDRYDFGILRYKEEVFEAMISSFVCL